MQGFGRFFRIEYGLCFWGALLLIICPLKWVLAICFASLFHELGHALMLRILGAKIYGIQFGLSGARMETGYLSPREEVLSAIAGPLFSFILLFAAKWFPRTAICGFVQGSYNLLPLFPMDGGRILKRLTEAFLP